MSLPKSYAEVARQLGLEYCGAPHPTTSDLYAGRVSWDDYILAGRIHWTERRVTRAGLRRFLMLGSKLAVGDGRDWRTLWKRIVWARESSRRLGIRIPDHLWSEDRARLRALSLAAQATTPEDKKLRRQALRWAGRRQGE